MPSIYNIFICKNVCIKVNRNPLLFVTFQKFTASNISFQVCLSQGVTYIVSPYESDAQLAFLVKQGYADFAITEDSDLLVYGCKEVCIS
jgi:hypothetical protein